MESGRVVRTRVPIGGGLFVFGSGYLVAPGRVLTARHVLSAPGQVASDGQLCQVRVWPCGPAQDWIDGSVEWLHDSRDVALVRADALGPDVDPVVWGQVVVDAPIEWTATGYPVASLDEDERVEEEALGVLAPISASSTGGLVLTITSREPTEGTVRHSGWEGLSGAAVFCGPALLGIVTADPAKYSGSLTGIRTSHIVDQPDFVDRLGVALTYAEVQGASARARVGQAGEDAAPGRDVAGEGRSGVDGDRVLA